MNQKRSADIDSVVNQLGADESGALLNWTRVTLWCAYASFVLAVPIAKTLEFLPIPGSAIAGGLPYLFGLVSGLIAAFLLRNFLWIAGASVFALVCLLSAVRVDATGALVVASLVLCVAPLAALMGGTAAPSWVAGFGLPGVILAGSVLILGASSIQILMGARDDNVTSLTDLSRASGTLTLLVGLPILAAFLRTQTPARLAFVAWVCVIAWVSDAKAALTLLVLGGIPALTVTLFKNTDLRTRLLSATAIATLALSLLASLSGFLTVAQAPPVQALAGEFSSGITSSIQLSVQPAPETPLHTNPNTGLPAVFVGTGPGTGASLTSLLATQGKLGANSIPQNVDNANFLSQIREATTGSGGGTIRSPVKTLSGLATEFGALGLSSWLLLLVITYMSAVRRLSGAAVPLVSFAPVLFLSLSLTFITSYFEYIEVGLALSLFVIVLTSRDHVAR